MQQRNDAGLLTDWQVAKRYGLSFHTLRKLRGRGGGPEFIKIGRAARYCAADVEAWIASRRRRSTSDSGA
jgi:predicted DNA-binding transcriptional regulator AlpA